MNKEKIILISAFSKPLRSGGWNAKNPDKSWWLKLIKLFKEKGYTIWQIGQGAELRLKLADRHLWDKDLWLLGEDIKRCTAWISPDNFFHHWALLQFHKPGFVIFSQSDPEIFGHKNNTNILKDKKFLRAKQYECWESASYDKDAFAEPEDVFAIIEKSINREGGENNEQRENTKAN